MRAAPVLGARPPAQPMQLPYNSESASLCCERVSIRRRFVWHPSPELIAQSNLQQFIDKHQLGSYYELIENRLPTLLVLGHRCLRSGCSILQTVLFARVDLSGGKPVGAFGVWVAK